VALNKFIKYNVIIYKHKSNNNLFISYTRKIFNLKCDWKNHIFTLPLSMTFFDQIKGSKIFTKLDFRSAYNLIRILDEDVWKTSFCTPKGQYEYLVMPFGLKNASAVFQRFINYIMKPFLDKFVAVNLDDILIYSKTKEEHISHVRQVL